MRSASLLHTHGMWRLSAFCRKSPINQRFLRFRQKKGCVFLVPQSDDISGGLPQGIGFGEREIYILAKGYFLTEEKYKR